MLTYTYTDEKGQKFVNMFPFFECVPNTKEFDQLTEDDAEQLNTILQTGIHNRYNDEIENGAKSGFPELPELEGSPNSVEHSAKKMDLSE